MNLRLSMLIKVRKNSVGKNDNLTNRVMVQIGKIEFDWPFLNLRRKI